MLINFYAIFVLLLGIVAGILIVKNNKKRLKHLLIMLRLASDSQYTYKLYDTLEVYPGKSYYNKLHLLHPIEYRQAVIIAKPHIQQSLLSEFKIVSKNVSLQCAKILILPFIVSILIGQVATLLSAVILSVTFYLALSILAIDDVNNIKKYRLYTILKHVYQIYNYKIQQGNCKSNILAQHQNVVPLTNTSLSASENTETHDAIISKIYSAPKANKPNTKSYNLTWQQLWWGSDLALCVLLVIYYLITSTDSFVTNIIGVIQICFMLQFFFVPAWQIIIICKRLISDPRALQT